MELSHLYEQTDRKGNIQQLKITVDYDPVERSWTLVKVLAIDCSTRSAVELTNIFFECFHDQAEEIIEGIKWEDKVAEQDPNPYKGNWGRVDPVFQKALRPFFK